MFGAVFCRRNERNEGESGVEGRQENVFQTLNIIILEIIDFSLIHALQLLHVVLLHRVSHSNFAINNQKRISVALFMLCWLLSEIKEEERRAKNYQHQQHSRNWDEPQLIFFFSLGSNENFIFSSTLNANVRKGSKSG